MRTPSRRSPSGRWLLYLATFLAAAGFRYLLLGSGFSNDHFIYITGGWQMQFGEWPTRDWVDAGSPLMSSLSGLAQYVFGSTLFAEAVVVCGGFGLASAMTVAAVTELTGALSLGVVAAALEVAVVPRTYGYPKMLVYAVAFLCLFRYVRQPDRIRLLAVSATIVFAFLLRHDHGVFVAVGAVVAVALSEEAAQKRLRRLVELAASAFVLALPYLVYVQVNGGVWSYFRTGVRFSQQEIGQQWHTWPRVIGDSAPFASALVYEYFAVPLIAAGVLFVCRDQPRARLTTAQVLPVIVVATMVNYTFLRPPLGVRLPDAIVPAVVLGAWLLREAMVAGRLRTLLMPLGAVCLALFSASVLEAGNTLDALERTELVETWRHIPGLFRDTTTELRTPLAPSQMPSRAAARLVPFYHYVDRCTAPDHRLLIGGFLPEVPFLARRPFAAGRRYFGGSFGADAEGERLALARLQRQSVPFALVPSDYAATFDAAFPLLGEHLRQRYRLLADVPVTDGLSIHLFVDTALEPVGRDPETGWPCFSPSPGAS